MGIAKDQSLPLNECLIVKALYLIKRRHSQPVGWFYHGIGEYWVTARKIIYYLPTTPSHQNQTLD